MTESKLEDSIYFTLSNMTQSLKYITITGLSIVFVAVVDFPVLDDFDVFEISTE